MPRITFCSNSIDCEVGDNLRRVLMKNGFALYNGIARAIHCRGMGTCGTCALKIKGDVSQVTKVERWRLNFPPHKADNNLRLACQCKVLGDLEIEKFDGMWGHRVGPNSSKTNRSGDQNQSRTSNSDI